MYKENTQTLRNSIKKFASDNHLTLTEIAKRAGIYLTSLSRLVSGKTKTVQLETLEKLQASCFPSAATPTTSRAFPR